MQESSVQESLSLELAQQDFKEWREKRKFGTRIPDELWQQAVDLTAYYSMSRVCRSLSLNFNDLKSRVLPHTPPTKIADNSSVDTGDTVNHANNGRDFLEVKIDGVNGSGSNSVGGLSMLGSSCLMELNKADGSTLKIYSSIGGRVDINRICETFLKS